jgi:hypothetical protein
VYTSHLLLFSLIRTDTQHHTHATQGKFAPTVPTRRKKVEDGAAAAAATAATAADAAAGNEAFSDLIRAAQADSKWTGRGRGGRGGFVGRGGRGLGPTQVRQA